MSSKTNRQLFYNFDFTASWSCRTTPGTGRVKLLDRVVRSASFLAGSVLDCNLAHRRSVAELYMLFKIKRNQMHPLSGELPLMYCRRVLLLVIWLLIGTRSRLLVVELVSIVEPLCPLGVSLERS